MFVVGHSLVFQLEISNVYWWLFRALVLFFFGKNPSLSVPILKLVVSCSLITGLTMVLRRILTSKILKIKKVMAQFQASAYDL